MFGYWRERRLYRREPVNLGWVQCTWMLGGLPLVALLNLWVLPALPVPGRVRRRIARTTVAGLAALAVIAGLAPAFAPANGDVYDVVKAMVLVVVPLLAGLVLHAVFGTAITDAYRTLVVWGGRQRGGLVLLLLPLFVGGLLSVAVLGPFLLLGEVLAR
jgi:hypothetical protein